VVKKKVYIQYTVELVFGQVVLPVLYIQYTAEPVFALEWSSGASKVNPVYSKTRVKSDFRFYAIERRKYSTLNYGAGMLDSWNVPKG
jgi:hypothetical protein